MMTAIYIIIIILQVGVIIYFIRRGRKQRAVKNVTAAGSNHENLRNTALHVTPAQLKLAIPDNETLVYGVVMDWNMGDTLITLVSFITGAASMYLSTGSGVLSSGKNPAAGEAASELVTLAQVYIYNAVPVTIFDMPPDGCVRFFLLTNHHILAAQEQVVFLENGTSPWLPLFEKANEVITEMRAGLN